MVATAARPPTPTPTAAPADAAPDALRISEVLADPVEPGVDRAYEWVELVNTSDGVVSTAGWGIGDAGSVDALPAVEVPPGGYVVVAAEAAVLPVNVLVARVPDGAIGNGLNNSGDVVRLVSPAGTVVDALSFGENRDVFDSPPAAAGAGATLGARLPVGGGEGGWAETLRPSPGGPNVLPEATPAPAAVATERVQEAASTASGTAVARSEATPTAPRATLAPLPTRFEREPGSRTPWIALGAVAGASIVVTLAATRGAWGAVRGRLRRGG